MYSDVFHISLMEILYKQKYPRFLVPEINQTSKHIAFHDDRNPPLRFPFDFISYAMFHEVQSNLSNVIIDPAYIL